MNKKGQLVAFLMEAIVAIILLFVLYQISSGLCQADSNFCTIGLKFFGWVLVGVYFIIKYGFAGRR